MTDHHDSSMTRSNVMERVSSWLIHDSFRRMTNHEDSSTTHPQLIPTSWLVHDSFRRMTNHDVSSTTHPQLIPTSWLIHDSFRHEDYPWLIPTWRIFMTGLVLYVKKISAQSFSTTPCGWADLIKSRPVWISHVTYAWINLFYIYTRGLRRALVPLRVDGQSS